MPQAIKAERGKKVEQQTRLGDLKAGAIFRFTSYTFEQALTGTDGATFYMVVDMQPKKTGRVTIVATDGGPVLERDDTHQVIVHPAVLVVSKAKYV